MGYNTYHPHDLDALDEKLAEVAQYIAKLRELMLARTPKLFHLNSFETAKHHLAQVLETLDKCPSQIKSGDKYMQRAKTKGKNLNKRKPPAGKGSK